MATPEPTPGKHAVVKDDPWRPNKAIVAAVIAALTEVLGQTQNTLPWWAVLLIGAVIAGLATFVTPNPKVANTQR